MPVNYQALKLFLGRELSNNIIYKYFLFWRFDFSDFLFFTQKKHIYFDVFPTKNGRKSNLLFFNSWVEK